MALASISDLEDFLGRAITTDLARRQASLMLDKATGEIQSYCRQTLELVEDDEVVLKGNWTPRLSLPQRPVVEVSSVSVDGFEYQDGVDRSFDGQHTIYRGKVSFLPNGDCCPLTSWLHWGGPDISVTVTYTHGYPPNETPDTIKGICLASAARGINNPSGGVSSETLGPYTYTSSAAATVLLPSEMRLLRDGGWRRTAQ